MAKNKVNDNGLRNNIPEAIREWYFCIYEIKRLEKKKEECSKNIKLELDSARAQDYSNDDIQELIGSVSIPSWYLIDNI